MRNPKIARVCTLGAVSAVLAVGMLVMVTAGTRSTMASEWLPGKSLSELSCRDVYGGGIEECKNEAGPQCEGNAGDRKCVASDYGVHACASGYEGVNCGSGKCTGVSHAKCTTSDEYACSMSQSGKCCSLSTATCVTGTAGGCTCSGDKKTEDINNLKKCTS